MPRAQYAVYGAGMGSARPLFQGSLSACLDFARHELKQGRDVTIVVVSNGRRLAPEA